MVPCIAFSQQVTTDPASTHIFPAGGRRGSRVEVRVGGECLPPATRFRLWGDGVTAPPELGERTSGQYAPSPRRKPGEQQVTYPREWRSQVEIAAEAPLGVKLWRLSCARGGAGARPFVVGDLPEFIETEPNSLPDEAQRVELPVTLNGQIAGESDLDYYRFNAQAGDVVRVDVAAARLGSALDPIVEVFGPDSRRIAADDVRVGADPVLAFRAPTSGEFRLLVSNVTFRGGPSYVYRITLSTAPLVRFAFPPGGQAGTTRDIDFFALAGDGSLKLLRERVSLPAASGEFWMGGPVGANAVPLVAGDLPEGLEIEGNNSRESATELAWPLVMNGQLQTIDDEDWFRLNCRQAVPLSIECSVHPNWSPALPIVSVTDANGGVLASASAVQAARGNLRLEWRPPADGTYWLRVRDLQQGVRGGPEFVYRLSVREAVPDFALSLKADVINVVQGG
ncbi:MAG: PPC domain-containing protein, partial [Candidatus Saccharimonas sp.]|nr:PPC domain-containing protein [Planctomycetaceae bacterium]